MATAYIADISDRDLGRNIQVQRLGIIHETAAQPVGVGANRPWIALFMEVQATGAANVQVGNYGRLRVRPFYADTPPGTTTPFLATFNAPFGAVSAQGKAAVSIPFANPAWVKATADGQFGIAVEPADATPTSGVVDAGSRDRFALDPNQQLIGVGFYWTPIA